MKRLKDIKIYKKISKRLVILISSLSVILIIFSILLIPVLVSTKANVLHPQNNPVNNDTPIKDDVISSDQSYGIQKKDEITLPEIIDSKIPNFAPLTIPIFTYHHIRPLDSVSSSDSLGRSLSVSPINFKTQLNQFVSLGYNSITYKDLLNFLQKKTALPKKPAMINFDDGYKDVFTNAMPILIDMKLKASFAIITNDVGKIDYMNWDDIKTLKKDNFEIVSHTVNHPDLSKISSQKLVYELKESKRVLDVNLNQNTFVIVYPAGKYNNNVENIASQQGYLLGRAFYYGRIITKDSLLSIPGVRMKDNSVIK